MRMIASALGALLLWGALVALGACRSAPSTPPPPPDTFADSIAGESLGSASLGGVNAPRPSVDSTAVRATATQLWVVGYFRASAAATSLVDSAGPNSGGGAQGHTLAATAVRDSFAFPLAAAGTTMSGYFGLKACNAGGCSAMTFKGWSYAVPVTIPATPTLDSLKVFPSSATFDTLYPPGTSYALVGLVETARAGRVAPGSLSYAPIQFCCFAHWSDGTWGRVTNDTAVARCNALWLAVPLPNKVARVFQPPPDFQIRLAARADALPSGMPTAERAAHRLRRLRQQPPIPDPGEWPGPAASARGLRDRPAPEQREPVAQVGREVLGSLPMTDQ
jgi:hypothetical protein